MTITMHDTRIPTIAELERFVPGSRSLTFEAAGRTEAYVWMETTLRAYGYQKRPRKEKGLIRRYLERMTGYSRSQVTRCVARYCRTTHVACPVPIRHRFPVRYTREDAVLLAGVDEAHDTLSGPATKRILVREFTVFRNAEFVRLAGISVSHLYNLRRTVPYRNRVLVVRKTRPKAIPIGIRKKPEPGGVPGFLRVDTVHQGDAWDGRKGVYHLNLVDEVVQWELVVAVPCISERAMEEALAAILEEFPFRILNFHSDNGGEYINTVVARLLDTLRVNLTKGRPRHSQDNGLVETKNGSVVRKAVGYGYIPGDAAALMNRWYRQWLNPYLNFHRPCAFPTEAEDAKGRIVRTYRTDDYRTPYEKLKSLPSVPEYLKPGVTFAALDRFAYAQSDTEFAKAMQSAKQRLRADIAQLIRSQQHPSSGSSLD